MAVKRQPHETVAYSHIIWPDKATHDANTPKAMAEMQALGDAHPVPFDGKRMIFASFQTLVEA